MFSVDLFGCEGFWGVEHAGAGVLWADEYMQGRCGGELHCSYHSAGSYLWWFVLEANRWLVAG